MEDLATYLPKLLVVSGAALQFLRQYKAVSDVWYHLAAVLLCGLSYLLVMDMTPDFRIEVVRFLVWLPDNLPVVWGGTFAMSTASRAMSNVTPLMPVTNSR